MVESKVHCRQFNAGREDSAERIVLRLSVIADNGCLNRNLAENQLRKLLFS